MEIDYSSYYLILHLWDRGNLTQKINFNSMVLCSDIVIHALLKIVSYYAKNINEFKQDAMGALEKCKEYANKAIEFISAPSVDDEVEMTTKLGGQRSSSSARTKSPKRSKSPGAGGSPKSPKGAQAKKDD